MTYSQRPKINDCDKCGGEGWLWGRELDNASEDTAADTMTRYTCDKCEAEPAPWYVPAPLPPKHDHEECHRILRGVHALEEERDEALGLAALCYRIARKSASKATRGVLFKRVGVWLSERESILRAFREHRKDVHGEKQAQWKQLSAKVDIARQAFTTIYNCNGAPEQWERGKRVLVELLAEWDKV